MFSIVIPVYRSAVTLPELHHKIVVFFENLAKPFEILFIEDCGGDNSWEIITFLAGKDHRVRGFRMSRNYGQHNALLCGIRKAKGDVIITMDDDLQHSPVEIPKLLAKLEEGYDVVYGPPDREQHGLLRNLASKITKLALEGAMGANNARNISAFRIFRTELRNAFAEYRSPSVNIDVLLSWATANFASVPVNHDQRMYGISGYTPRKLVSHALNMMTGYSIRPLQIATLMGFGFASFGIVVLAYVVISWFLHGSKVPGFAFLTSIIIIFSGAQLLALGIVGEYLARMHFRTMERPPYLVRESIEH